MTGGRMSSQHCNVLVEAAASYDHIIHNRELLSEQMSVHHQQKVKQNSKTMSLWFLELSKFIYLYPSYIFFSPCQINVNLEVERVHELCETTNFDLTQGVDISNKSCEWCARELTTAVLCGKWFHYIKTPNRVDFCWVYFDMFVPP